MIFNYVRFTELKYSITLFFKFSSRTLDTQLLEQTYCSLLLEGGDDGVLLVLLLLDLVQHVDLFNVVLELVQLVEVHELGDDQDGDNWAHSVAVASLHHAFHVLSGLFITNFQENGHEFGALLSHQMVQDHEGDEVSTGSTEDLLGGPVFADPHSPLI